MAVSLLRELRPLPVGGASLDDEAAPATIAAF